jgi:MoaA/NifB/PqqE/SkfB family radical SAM enzyme
MTNLTVDINGECNMDCEFCYQNLDGSKLSVNEVMAHAGESRFTTIEIGGGEPLLHKGIFEMLQKVAKSGKKSHVSTNATFIPKRILDLEKSVRNATIIQVSLHAGNARLYYEITGRNMFGRVIENTRRYKDFYRTLMTAVIYRKNVDNVPEIVQVAGHLGVHLRLNLVMPVGKGKFVDPIDQGQLQGLRTYLFSEKMGGRDISSPLLQFNNCIAIENAYGIKKRGVCPFDIGKRYVNPKGEVSNCEFVEARK